MLDVRASDSAALLADSLFQRLQPLVATPCQLIGQTLHNMVFFPYGRTFHVFNFFWTRWAFCPADVCGYSTTNRIFLETWDFTLQAGIRFGIAKFFPASRSTFVYPYTEEWLVLLFRFRHMTVRTKQTNEHWLARFFQFHKWRPASALGPDEVSAFLEYLAIERRVSSPTQKVAPNALVFFFREVLGETHGRCRALHPCAVQTKDSGCTEPG